MEEMIPFNRGLNLDDELIPDGSYRDANNIIIGTDIDSQEGGTVRGIKSMDSISSNEDIATLFGASGDITYLDSATDNEDQDIVYILAEADGSAHIVKYIISTDTASLILTYTTSPQTYQHFFRVLGDVIIWNYNEDYAVYSVPKTSTNLSTSNGYELSIVGQAPLSAPSITITGTDFSLLFSERAWQFAHRFVYADGRVSSLSPFSDIVGYQEEDEVNTNISEVQVSITETFNTTIGPAKLEVYVRESDIGTWRRAITFDSITSGVASTFTWSGQRFETLESDFANSLFNFAPKYAKSADVIDNRIFLGNGKYFDDDETGTLSISIASGNGVAFASGDYISSFASGVSTSTYRPFSNRTTYRIGVIGLDNNGRNRGIESEAEFNTGDFDYPVIPQITISASGTLPTWMTKYQVVVSESQTKDYLYEGLATAVYYQSLRDEDTYFTTAQDEFTEYMVVDIKDMFSSNLIYSFNQGDQIRGKFGSTVVSQVDIVAQVGSKIFCRIPENSEYVYNATVDYDKLWVEIISPKESVDFTYYGTQTIGDTSGLPDTVNIEGDTFSHYKNVAITTSDYLVKKSGRVSTLAFSATGLDVVEFSVEDFLPQEVEGISSYLNVGDNSGFYVEEASLLRFNAIFTVDSYTGTGSVSVISRDVTDNSISSGEIVGAKSINLNSFVSAAGSNYQLNREFGDNQLVKIDSSNAIWFYENSGNLYAQFLAIAGSVVSLNGSATTLKSTNVSNGSSTRKEMDAFLIDSTHVAVFYTQGTSGGNGYCRVYTIDTGAATITSSGSELEFHAASTYQISANLIDSSNAIVWYGDNGDGDVKGQLLSIASGDTISLNGSAYAVPSSSEDGNIDSFIRDASTAVLSFGQSGELYLQMFTYDTGAGTITNTGSSLLLDTSTRARIKEIDDSNLFVGWDDNVALFSMNASGDITTNGSTVSTGLTGVGKFDIDSDGSNIAGIYYHEIVGNREFSVLGFSYVTGTGTVTVEEQFDWEQDSDRDDLSIVSMDSGSFLALRDNKVSNTGIVRLFNVGSGSGEYNIRGEISVTGSSNVVLAVDADTISLSDVTLELGYASDYLFAEDGSNLKHTIVEGATTDLSLLIRSVNLSSKSTFWRKGLGKPAIEIDANLSEYLTNRIYYGQKYLKTNVNPFNYFYFDDVVEVPFEVGEVNALVNTSTRSSSPGTLLVLCEEKPVSIYVGANLITNTDGTTSLIASDRVVNGTNVLSGNDGFQLADKNTIVSYDGQAFWRDAKGNGAICRYTNAGVFKISDIKMKSYFNSVKNTVAKASYDPYYGMYLITINGKTAGFLEDKWISFYTDRLFVGKAETIVNDQIYTFEDASGTLLAKKTLGSDQACDITLAKHTLKPIEPKYLNVVLTGMSSSGDLRTPSDTNFSVVVTNEKNQQSTLTNFDFIIEDQDFLYADIMRDENSTGGKVAGDELVGSKHLVKVNIPSGDRMRLLTIGSEPSLGH